MVFGQDQMTCYFDGNRKRVIETTGLQPAQADADLQAVNLGASPNGSASWQGRSHGIAFYNTAVTAEQADLLAKQRNAIDGPAPEA